MRVLGIETSCDETAAAVVTGDRCILSNIVLSQTALHRDYGGVVPEIAARAHSVYIAEIIKKALAEAHTGWEEVDAVAATAGPGLIGGVIVGLMTAKGIASALGKPLIAVNHLEGHALTVRLTHDVSFPFLLLLVSGGHCQSLIVEGVGKYQLLGGTLDDALGEAFDKTAKMLGLGYPGGPAVEKRAQEGDPVRFGFPRSMVKRAGCDFSFSGLKTAVFRTVHTLRADGALTEQMVNDICASFQAACGDIMMDRLQHAIVLFKRQYPSAGTVVIAGGVAANQYLRGRLESICEANGMRLVAPPIKLCTDNAAMIAWVGVERFRLGLTDGLNTMPKARWRLGDPVLAGYAG